MPSGDSDIKSVSVSMDTLGGSLEPMLLTELATAMYSVNGYGNEQGLKTMWLDVTTGSDSYWDNAWATAYYQQVPMR